MIGMPINMPKSCGCDCPCLDSEFGNCDLLRALGVEDYDVNDYWMDDMKHPKCPLVEIKEENKNALI